MGWIVLLLVIVIAVLSAIIVVYYDSYGLPPQAEGIWDVSPIPGVDCASGSRTTNAAGTPLPPCPTATPVTTTAKNAAYDKGYTDGHDAVCDLATQALRGRISPEAGDRELDARRSRGLERYDARVLRDEYRRGWQDAETQLEATLLAMGFSGGTDRGQCA